MAKKPKPASDVIREAVIDECAKCVPTTWLDPLLSGDARVIVNSPTREIEALLRGVQDRMRALKSPR